MNVSFKNACFRSESTFIPFYYRRMKYSQDACREYLQSLLVHVMRISIFAYIKKESTLWTCRIRLFVLMFIIFSHWTDLNQIWGYGPLWLGLPAILILF